MLTVPFMRQDERYFGEQELVLIYIGKRLRDAQRLETLLDQSGVDYLIEVDYYRGGFLFVTERAGAFFYTTDAQAQLARNVMLQAGFRPFLPGEGQTD